MSVGTPQEAAKNARGVSRKVAAVLALGSRREGSLEREPRAVQRGAEVATACRAAAASERSSASRPA